MPTTADAKGEATGEGETDNLRKYQVYRQMLADWFNEPEDVAAGKAELFEKQAKKRFIEQPGQLKLLIVVDKLLTGFDSPPATYLYIDKKMQDHGLFQAICRVNRLDGEDKPYGYIIDYKDLFKPLEGAVAVRGIASLDLFVRPGASQAQRAAVLDRWYREQLKALVAPMFTAWQAKLGVQVSAWGVKRMKTKWGSCTPASRRVWLNSELAKKPVECIEYIVVHELLHLAEPNHGERFVALMNRHLPRWAATQKRLNAAPLGYEEWEV